MSDGFDTLITRANSFFTQLRANNTRDFYEAHKAAYTDLVKKPAELLADLPDGWQDDGLLKMLNRMIPASLPVWKILDQSFPG